MIIEVILLRIASVIRLPGGLALSTISEEVGFIVVKLMIAVDS